MSVKVSVAPVRSESDYTEALARIDELFNAPEGTPEFDEFDVLTILVHEYEQRLHPVGPAEPAATLTHYLDRMEMSPKDLEPYIGTKSMVSMVLNGHRPLTVKMIRNLHAGLHIPVSLLVGSLDLTAKAS
jgi:HTH-type transcriptional regulator/antitoxin HigA